MTTNEVAAMVFDTILSTPGMNEPIKIDFKISRKNVLVLAHVIERGLDLKEGGAPSDFLTSIGPESLQELKTLADECLQKAGLVETNEKLVKFGGGK